MNVPLSVTNYPTKTKRPRERFLIWHDRKCDDIQSPIYPYFYSYSDLTIEGIISKEKIRKRALSDFQEHVFYKYSFPTRASLTSYRDMIRTDERYKDVHTFEDNIPFILRNRIDNPDVFRKFPHTKPLGFHLIDIEQETPPDKIFPTTDERIISISFQNNDEKIVTGYLVDNKSKDKKLLERYREAYETKKPDVLVVYNKMYDIYMIVNRCKKNGITTKWIGRGNSEPYFGGKHRINIPGVVIYDVYDSSSTDQSLTGNVATRGLKDVSNYFGFKTDIEVINFETTKSIDLIGSKELIDYNKDDIRRLKFLHDVYWGTVEYQAEDLGIPLDMATDLNITDLGIIVLGDLYREHNIIADGDNATRYPDIFKRKKKKDEKNYQGALSYNVRKGLFVHVFKADVGSMYPSIMSEFNFSPDTCTLIGYEDYVEDGFKIVEKEHSYLYYIPDNQINSTVVIESLKRKGFLSIAVRRFLDERSEYKKQYKKTGDKRYLSKSNHSKVKANGGIYGVMGNPHHPFGFVPAAIATTGIGRECAKVLVDILEESYPRSVTNLDTDGVHFSAPKIDEEKIISLFNKRLKEKFKRDLNIYIDIDSYDKGYFHKSKNYILQKGEKIILHGVAMKASSKSKIKMNLIKELAVAKLNEEPIDDIIKKYTDNLLDFPLRDFAMHVTMGMHPWQYKNKSCIACQIAKQAKDNFNLEPSIGNEYYYIKENDGYVLYQLAKKDNIDIDYYIDDIYSTLKIFEPEMENPNKKKKIKL